MTEIKCLTFITTKDKSHMTSKTWWHHLEINSQHLEYSISKFVVKFKKIIKKNCQSEHGQNSHVINLRKIAVSMNDSSNCILERTSKHNHSSSFKVSLTHDIYHFVNEKIMVVFCCFCCFFGTAPIFVKQLVHSLPCESNNSPYYFHKKVKTIIKNCISVTCHKTFPKISTTDMNGVLKW